MDIVVILIYYLIIAISFSISTFITYIWPTVGIAREIAGKYNVLDQSNLAFFCEYCFWTTITFPWQLYDIIVTDSEIFKDRIVDILVDEEK
jgi:hypothetical protein